jgi:hypothetical protein
LGDQALNYATKFNYLIHVGLSAASKKQETVAGSSIPGKFPVLEIIPGSGATKYPV